MTIFGTLSRDILAVGISGAGGQIVTFLTLPILARLYSPESFGGWALFVSTGLLIGAVATLRYELAVVLPPHHRAAAALLVAGILAAVAFTLVTALLTPLIANLLIGPEEARRLGWAFWMLPLLIMLNAMFQCGLAWCTRRMAFNLYSSAQFLLPTAAAAAQILLALWGLRDSSGLVIGTVIGYMTVSVVVWSRMIALDRSIIVSGTSPRRIVTMARKYFQYPCYMTPYTLLSALRDRSIYFLLGRFADVSVVGFYSMAQRFTNLPNSFVSGAVRPVFFQHASRRELFSLGPAVLATMLTLLQVAIPNLVMFWFHTEAILRIFLGPQWIDAAPYAIALSVPALPLLLGNWFDRVLDVAGRQRLAFKMEMIFSVAALASLFAGFIVFGGIWPAVIAQAAAMTVYFSIWIVVVFRVAGFPSDGPFRLLAAALVLIGGCALLLWVMERLLSAPFGIGAYYLIYFCALAYLARQYLRRLPTLLA